jgi:hypothetical protein
LYALSAKVITFALFRAPVTSSACRGTAKRGHAVSTVSRLPSHRAHRNAGLPGPRPPEQT